MVVPGCDNEVLKGVIVGFISMIRKGDVPKPSFGCSQPRSIDDIVVKSDVGQQVIAMGVANQVGFHVFVTRKKMGSGRIWKVWVCHLRYTHVRV